MRFALAMLVVSLTLLASVLLPRPFSAAFVSQVETWQDVLAHVLITGAMSWVPSWYGGRLLFAVITAGRRKENAR